MNCGFGKAPYLTPQTNPRPMHYRRQVPATVTLTGSDSQSLSDVFWEDYDSLCSVKCQQSPDKRPLEQLRGNGHAGDQENRRQGKDHP